MRNNTTKILEEAYKQVIRENRISQMQPEEIMSLDPATLNTLTIGIGELARLSDEQLRALKAVASKLTYKGLPDIDSKEGRRLATKGLPDIGSGYNPSGMM